MNHEQGLPIFYFIDFSKLVKQSKFAIKNFFKCFELGIICRKAPKVVPECPAFKVMEVGEWRWVQAARLGQEGGSSTRCSSRARSFLQALALGTGCPALHPIDLRAGLAVQHRGEGSLGSRHPISVEKITRRFPSEKRLARGTRIWTRAARAPTGGVRGGDLAPAAAAGRAEIPPPPSSRFAASEAKAARSRPAEGAPAAQGLLCKSEPHGLPLVRSAGTWGGVPSLGDVSPTLATQPGPDRCVAPRLCLRPLQSGPEAGSTRPISQRGSGDRVAKNLAQVARHRQGAPHPRRFPE